MEVFRALPDPSRRGDSRKAVVADWGGTTDSKTASTASKATSEAAPEAVPGANSGNQASSDPDKGPNADPNKHPNAALAALSARSTVDHDRIDADRHGHDSSVASGQQACGLAIGNFDGVHLGHQAIVRQLREAAAGLPVTVMTFEPHPREFFAARRGVSAPARISTETDRLNALRDCGVDKVFIVPFDEQFASMPARTFIDSVICDAMQARHLMVGDDFRFGAHRQGNYEMLREHAAGGNYVLHQMPTLTQGSARISSSLVRDALQRADFDQVKALLGRPYTISGTVTRGKQLGRKLGFPTINLPLAFSRPALSGIFVVRVAGLARHPLPGVASLGVRPAVESDGRHLLEVHLFDFERQVYGQDVQVEFLKKLRDEENFETLEALTEQIATDARLARAFFASSGN